MTWFNEFLCPQSAMNWRKTSTDLKNKKDIKEGIKEISIVFSLFLVSQELFPLCSRCGPPQEYRAAEKAFQIWRLKGGHTVLSIICPDKQIISSSFWSQLNMENNLGVYTKKEKVFKGVLWKLWKVEVGLATSEALIHGSWMCGIADVVKDFTLKAWKASHLLGDSVMRCALLVQHFGSPEALCSQCMFVCGETCPHFVNSFNTLIGIKALVCTLLLPNHVFSMLTLQQHAVIFSPLWEMSPGSSTFLPMSKLLPSSTHQRKTLFAGVVKWLTQDQTAGQ